MERSILAAFAVYHLNRLNGKLIASRWDDIHESVHLDQADVKELLMMFRIICRLDCRINIYNTCLTCGSHILNRIDSLFNIFITVNFAILIS